MQAVFSIVQIALMILIAGTGLVQFVAIWDGIDAGIGLGSFIGFIGSMILVGVPLLGSLIGVYGAVEVWGWDLLPAVALFCWYIPVILIGFMLDRAARR